MFPSILSVYLICELSSFVIKINGFLLNLADSCLGEMGNASVNLICTVVAFVIFQELLEQQHFYQLSVDPYSIRTAVVVIVKALFKTVSSESLFYAILLNERLILLTRIYQCEAFTRCDNMRSKYFIAWLASQTLINFRFIHNNICLLHKRFSIVL